MQVGDVLNAAWGELAPLHRPVLVLALRGLFDVADVATDAVQWLTRPRPTVTVASIDPDPFFDFTQERPEVTLDEGGIRSIRWPANDVQIMRLGGETHDLVLLSGVEPHVHWRTFVDAIVEVAKRTQVEVVVTLGASPEAVPHTRTPTVVASSSTPALAQRLGLSPPRYQGPTGVVGVLQERLQRAGIPGVSLRVPVPHYLVGASHPKCSAALLRHLEHVLKIPTGHDQLAGEIARWQQLHDQAVAEDAQARTFVTLLENDYDRRTEASLPSGDDLAAAFEAFLADQRGDGDADDDGPPPHH
jgi:proteasome assembly chaperone (PAC2) family protein